jgi:hypothetical protein
VPAAHDGPWPCVPASVRARTRPCHGGSITVCHLAPMLSADRPPPAHPMPTCLRCLILYATFALRRSNTTSPPRSPIAHLGSPLRRLSPHVNELLKKVPQAPRAPPPRDTGLCSSQAASPKTAPKPLHRPIPSLWTPPHHRPPLATDRPC